ncbi:DUF397 domain-containing protein [Actinomadura bangladeshensis]|uniref:DUF397 domain-containing protein n=1 Tax=Actinomadura bangladeshensis TaxID=453573 RepID=A0A4R4P8X2_9ACTN|nr:DUF397 domain-containing protein [Actinomadura bangladeshensis]TDC18489.1 DUF397 domain-containing protein [Actinomadura bangladeshensis]
MKRDLPWRKSSHSGSDGGECVELASAENGVAIRDSKDPEGPVVLVRPAVLREAIRRATA